MPLAQLAFDGRVGFDDAAASRLGAMLILKDVNPGQSDASMAGVR